MKPLAFIDCETTGLDPARHEILEIAVVRVTPTTLQSIAETSVRVRPTRIADADPAAMAVNGYTPEVWADAMTLHDALAVVGPCLEGAILAGHNASFDRAFLASAWKRTGVPRPKVDHHVMDTACLAWPLLVSGEVDSLSLSALCKHFGIEHAEPHRALVDARASLELARRLLPSFRPVRSTPVAWPDNARPLRVYVCHPYRDAPEKNACSVRAICRALVEERCLPVAPHLYLPAFVDESSERERAMALCLHLLDACDELRVYGSVVSEGMKLELEHADRQGIPVRYEEAL